jgi:hypothetical protein
MVRQHQTRNLEIPGSMLLFASRRNDDISIALQRLMSPRVRPELLFACSVVARTEESRR